ncbi:MAG: D-tyrosyl-tRNA(Tyr) deacylase [candidate division WOR-3 bacterium]|nr:MAG: D-tyrosyl-tRNA(Tyr) deacylase [candidate division WOR-3 bacterium]
MIALVQRVAEANVSVGNETVSDISEGILVLLGIKKGDTEEKSKRLAERCVHLRIFEDEEGKFNYSLKDVGGSALVVSQFTLLADTSRGRRPSFTDAEVPERSRHLYEVFARTLNTWGIQTKTGSFGERMRIRLVNNGPVTIILEE